MYSSFTKNIVILSLSIVAIFSASCNNKNLKTDLLKKSIATFKNSIKPIEIIEYIPEKYSEIQTDTILNNGYSIHIKTYTNNNKIITHKQRINKFSTKTKKYRNWISEVNIKKNGVVIFDKIINPNFILKHTKVTDLSLNKSVLMGAKFDDFLTTNCGSLYLYTVMRNPEKESNYIYSIKIDNQGNYSLNKLEQVKTI